MKSSTFYKKIINFVIGIIIINWINYFWKKYIRNLTRKIKLIINNFRKLKIINKLTEWTNKKRKRIMGDRKKANPKNK